MDENAEWVLVKTGGVGKWAFRFASAAFSFSAIVLFLTGSDGQSGLAMALVSGFAAAFLWFESSRLRIKWNEERIENHSHYFSFRGFAWNDLNGVSLTADGIGRVLKFGTKGEIELKPWSGRPFDAIMSVADLDKIEKFAREKLKENARTS